MEKISESIREDVLTLHKQGETSIAKIRDVIFGKHGKTVSWNFVHYLIHPEKKKKTYVPKTKRKYTPRGTKKVETPSIPEGDLLGSVYKAIDDLQKAYHDSLVGVRRALIEATAKLRKSSDE